MNDTPPAITAQMEDMFREKTPSERLQMGCSMFGLAKRLVVSSIAQENPHASSAELRKALFLRFYGNDFDQFKQKRILQYLTRDGEV